MKITKKYLRKITQEETALLLKELGEETIDPVIGAEVPIVNAAIAKAKQGDMESFELGMEAAKDLGIAQGIIAALILAAGGSAYAYNQIVMSKLAAEAAAKAGERALLRPPGPVLSSAAQQRLLNPHRGDRFVQFVRKLIRNIQKRLGKKSDMGRPPEDGGLISILNLSKIMRFKW